MFAFVIRRLLAGLLVCAGLDGGVHPLLVRPEEPGQLSCAAGTRTTAGPPAQARGLRGEPRVQQPDLPEYATWVKGVFVGREIKFGATVRLPGTVPGHLLPRPDPGLPNAQAAIPGTLSLAIGGATLYLLVGVTIGVPAARRRGTTRRQGAGRVHPGHQLDSVLPGRAARLALPHHLHEHLPERGVLPVHRQSGQVVHRAAPGLAGAGHLRLDAVHPVLPRRDGRVPRARTTSAPHGEGPAAADGRLSSTRCAPRWCRSSPSSASTSRSCSRARSSPSRSSDLEGIGFWGLEATYIKDLPVVQATACSWRSCGHRQHRRRRPLQRPRPPSEARMTLTPPPGGSARRPSSSSRTSRSGSPPPTAWSPR